MKENKKLNGENIMSQWKSLTEVERKHKSFKATEKEIQFSKVIKSTKRLTTDELIAESKQATADAEVKKIYEASPKAKKNQKALIV